MHRYLCEWWPARFLVPHPPEGSTACPAADAPPLRHPPFSISPPNAESDGPNGQAVSPPPPASGPPSKRPTSPSTHPALADPFQFDLSPSIFFDINRTFPSAEERTFLSADDNFIPGHLTLSDAYIRVHSKRRICALRPSRLGRGRFADSVLPNSVAAHIRRDYSATLACPFTALLLAPLAVLHAGRTLPRVPMFRELRCEDFQPWENCGAMISNDWN